MTKMWTMRSDHRGVWKKVTLVWCRTDICRKLSGRRRQGRAHRTRASAIRLHRRTAIGIARPRDQVSRARVRRASTSRPAMEGSSVQASRRRSPERRPSDRLGSDSRPGRPQARNAAGEARRREMARWRVSQRLRVQERHRAGRLPGSPGGGAGGHRDLRGKSPDFKLQSADPQRLAISRPPRGKSPDFMQIRFKLQSRPPGRLVENSAK